MEFEWKFLIISRDLTATFLNARAKHQRLVTGYVAERLEELESLSSASSSVSLKSFLAQPTTASLDESCSLCDKKITSKGILFSKLTGVICSICRKTACDACSNSSVVVIISPEQVQPYPKVTACTACERRMRMLQNKHAKWTACESSSRVLSVQFTEVTNVYTAIQQKLSNLEGLQRIADIAGKDDPGVLALARDIKVAVSTDIDRLMVMLGRIKNLACPPAPHKDRIIQDRLCTYVHDLVTKSRIKLAAP